MGAWVWVAGITLIALVFQTIELLWVYKSFRDDSIWSWTVLRKDFEVFPKIIRIVLDLTLNYRGFIILLWFRLLLSLTLLYWLCNFPANPSWVHSVSIITLFVSTVLISMRWAMTLVILSALSVSVLFFNTPLIMRLCLCVIAANAILSYTIAGWVKLFQAGWRSAQTLERYFNYSNYEVPIPLRNLVKRRWVLFIFSWSILIFECCFPLAVFNTKLSLLFLCIGFIFHIGNIYAFGLNRFLHIWMATYPAVYYFSQ
jgi:hypothetical protein